MTGMGTPSSQSRIPRAMGGLPLVLGFTGRWRVGSHTLFRHVRRFLGRRKLGGIGGGFGLRGGIVLSGFRTAGRGIGSRLGLA